MSDIRTAGMTEDEFVQMMQSAGMPNAGKVAGVSRTVVSSLAQAQVPQQNSSTVVFFTGDGSYSMLSNRALFVEAYNDFFLQGMLESAVPGSILTALAFFNDSNYRLSPSDSDFQEPLHVIHAPTILELAPKLTEAQYDIKGWNSETPLTDAISSNGNMAVAYSEKMLLKGKGVRVIEIYFSDGIENASRRVLAPEDLAPDLLRKRELGGYTQVFIGFGNNKAMFTNYALRAGFPDRNIMVVPNAGNIEESRKQLRRIMDIVSKQTVAASKGISDPNSFFE